MKRIFTFSLVLLICTACFASCAQVEQKIGEVVSVAAVDAVASQFEENDAPFERADEQGLADIRAALTQEYELALQGNVTAALIGGETNEQTGEWVKYWVLGFDTTADAEAFEQLASAQLQSEISENKAVIVGGGYIVSITVSSLVIEQ